MEFKSQPSEAVVIIVPYGDLHPEESRATQLAKYIEYMTKAISTQHPEEKTYIIISEQISPKTYFNRAQLLNAGYLYFKNNYGGVVNIVLHDVDILPSDDMLDQYFARHLSRSLLNPNSKEYRKAYGEIKMAPSGGVYTVNSALYEAANGMPNNFWGWGGEDNAYAQRLKHFNIVSDYSTVGTFSSIDNKRESHAQKMEYIKKKKIRNMAVWEQIKEDQKIWRREGLSNCKAKLDKTNIVKEGNIEIVRLYWKLDDSTMEERVSQSHAIYDEIKKNADNPNKNKKLRGNDRGRGRGRGNRGRGRGQGNHRN